MKIQVEIEDLPPGAFEKALAAAVREACEDLQLLDAEACAGLLAVSVPRFRQIATERKLSGYDLGQRGARWSLKQIRELLREREVKWQTTAPPPPA